MWGGLFKLFFNSLKSWFQFAKISWKHCITLIIILAYYIGVGCIASFIYIGFLFYYCFKFFNSNDNIIISLELKNLDHLVKNLLIFNLFLEPRSRAFNTARKIWNAKTQKSQKLKFSYLIIFRVLSYSFRHITYIPFLYIEHINFWVEHLKIFWPETDEDYQEFLLEYILYGFD